MSGEKNENLDKGENKVNRKRYEQVIFSAFFISAVLMTVTGAGFAKVGLPSVISDNMVLQRGMKVPIWGWARPGERVKVRCSWQEELFTTKADSKGRWKLKVEAPEAGGPYEMVVRGRNMIKIKDILCGEVWICSGQSNMEMSVRRVGGWRQGMSNRKRAGAKVDDPGLRLFKVKKTIADEPQKDCGGRWRYCRGEVVEGFSAVAYFFGRELRNELDVPVGLIQSCWGGTVAEAWMRDDVLKKESDFAPILERFEQAKAEYKKKEREYNERLEEWMAAVKKAREQGQEDLNRPEIKKPGKARHKNSPSSLYNGMLAPLIPYGMRGVIWYQGESNVKRAYQYRKLFPALIKNWRLDWGQGDFPFYYVQIAPYKYGMPYSAAELREAQLMAMSLRNTGMVVTTDIGNVDDIHPRNKLEVSRRLSLWAFSHTYGLDIDECSGPVFDSMDIEGGRIRVNFEHAEGGLSAKGGRLTGFEIAGEDRKYDEANAEIQGSSVVVWSPDVENPLAVRFGWSNTAEPNLFNKAGLPASPFRTDGWGRVTMENR